MDSTKELCSDNRHRILHNLWGIRRVLIPIFGPTLINSDGKTVNIKDLCEQDHILPDYSNRFIPTLSDFACEIEDLTEQETQLINELHKKFSFSPKETELLLSPLTIHGSVNALLITHNSWFINHIMPKIFRTRPCITEFAISPDLLFQKMKFSDWMNGGMNSTPQSCNKIEDLI